MILFTKIVSTPNEYTFGDKLMQMRLTLTPITNVKPLTACTPNMLFPFTFDITVSPIYKNDTIIYSKHSLPTKTIDSVVWMSEVEYEAFKIDPWHFYNHNIASKMDGFTINICDT